MKISFAGHDFILHHSGLAFWPAKDCALVSDLHLEKGSHFARRHYYLPPYDSHRTLENLTAICAKADIKQLIILGDCFHDPEGYERLSPENRELFDALLRYNPVWIKGNHDRDFVPPGLMAHESFISDGVVFRHEAEGGAADEISGHFHPKTDIVHKGASLSRRCFIEDGRKLILPAFGAYAGGLNIRSPEISGLLTAPFRVYALGENRVFALLEQR